MTAPSTISRRRLGATGPEVSALGLGCMAMSGGYGPPDRAEGIATIHAALDSGINLLDTGDFYGMGHNELLIAEALRDVPRDRVVLSVKFGAQRGPAGDFLGFDARPAAVKTALAHSLTRLGTDHLDVYRPARLDPAVPIEDTIGAIAELVAGGYVRHIGLSEVGAETIRRAHAVHPIVDLQIEYSLLSRRPEEEILPTCRELGIAVTAYGVLGRGMLSGRWTTDGAADPGAIRGRMPRFQGENLARNLALVAALIRVAEARGATPSQVAIGWALAKSEDIVPLIGARRRDQLVDGLGAATLELSEDDLGEIERAVPADAVAGDRYDSRQMDMLDSER